MLEHHQLIGQYHQSRRSETGRSEPFAIDSSIFSAKFRERIPQHQEFGWSATQVPIVSISDRSVPHARMSTGTIVDATLIAAPSSAKNAGQSRNPEMHQSKKGKPLHDPTQICRHSGARTKSRQYSRSILLNIHFLSRCARPTVLGIASGLAMKLPWCTPISAACRWS